MYRVMGLTVGQTLDCLLERQISEYKTRSFEYVGADMKAETDDPSLLSKIDSKLWFIESQHWLE